MTAPAGIAGLDEAGEAGFTLVELLVAVALLGLVSLTLFGSLRFGVAAWGRGTSHADQTAEILSIQNFLRRIIADAYPMFLPDGQGRGHVDFNGMSQSLDFLAPTPVALGSGGRSRFRVSLESRAAQSDVTVTTQPELSDDSSATVKKSIVAGVRSVAFKYFGVTRSDKVAQWHEDWIRQANLPGLLSIRIVFPEGDQRLWPELIVAPRIAADVACVVDLLTHRCSGR
ncbi:MAG TPA: prepilin-type N-terminal cleavage/methylation domain-containing protein [Xanthobacteraceae bacterium]|jgi:general secretion pathway protein J